jgi:hypothetical protein
MTTSQHLTGAKAKITAVRHAPLPLDAKMMNDNRQVCDSFSFFFEPRDMEVHREANPELCTVLTSALDEDDEPQQLSQYSV